ncbi:MAG: hypothetical protein ABC378_00010 [Staphylococcus pseudoxylosus]|uniref:hypothetical protein n=1 Tax=Staphylococcus pseudoxylosus TaxID=2282419 RepID=UPI0031F62781
MKKLLSLLLASFLVLVACGQEESKSEDKKETKSSDKNPKKDNDKKSENKKGEDNSDDKKDESEEVASNNEKQNQQAQVEQPQEQQGQQNSQQPTQEIQGGNDAGASEEQQAFLRESDPEYYSEVDENYINRDAEFYDSLPQSEQDKLKRHTDNMADADEDDPRWDEQLEINMRDDISDEERRELSDQVWD